MAGGMDLGTGGKGGKKPLDATINLVPFIDLMAVTISFLIMTAVWTQIGRLQVASQGNGDPTQEQDKKEIPPLTLMLSKKELKLSVGQNTLPAIPISYGTGNRIELALLRANVKKVTDEIKDENQITVQTDDDVRYDDLVQVIDELVGDGLPNVSVSPANG